MLSCNVSLDAFEDEPAIFRALIARAKPDVVSLDEVHPEAVIIAGHHNTVAGRAPLEQ